MNIKMLSYKYKLLIIALYFTGISCTKNTGGAGGGTPLPVPTPIPTNTTFTNPLLSSGPDPWVIKKDNYYYYTNTLGNRIAVWKTSKMSELRNVSSQTIWSAPSSGPNSKDVWAPEIHFINNKWYAYYAADDGNNANHRIYVLENSSADPLSGTWESKGKINDVSDKWAIDATIFDLNGQLYMLWSGWEGNVDGRQDIYIAKLLNPWTIEGSRVMISTPTYNWETIGSPDVNEGPEIIKNSNGKVFLIYSASFCGVDDYALGMLTLKDGGNPMNAGDWSKTPTPVFSKNPSGGAYGPGHNSFFKSLDGTEDWILYHANSSSGLGCGDARSPRMQMFTWNADGIPNFGQPVAVGQTIKKPSGE